MTRDKLIALLEETIVAIRANDSFQGSIEYDVRPEPGEWTFNVNAAVRIGNSEGQGGMILVQEWEPCGHPCDELIEMGEQSLCPCTRKCAPPVSSKER